MSRTMPEVFLRQTSTDLTDFEVCAAKEFWCVTYKGQIFITRRSNKYHPSAAVKYDRTTYPHHKPALNKADALNKMFGCNDFAVARLELNTTQGDTQ